MAITAKSLHHANIVCIYSDAGFYMPDNGTFASLYSGADSKGARFIEDPVLQTKMLVLPEAKIKVTLEGRRLRVDDDSDKEPKDSRIVRDMLAINAKLFGTTAKLAGFGFNYDIVYRFNTVIPIQALFKHFFGEKALEKQILRDIGIQFSLEDKHRGIVDTWFVKVLSPLEIAVHLNRHFNNRPLPKETDLVALFSDCYTRDTDALIQSFEENLSFE